MRLQKFIAECGIASRRSAEKIIESGRVYVNGDLVDYMGCVIDPDVDVVEIDGKVISQESKKYYIALNKPKNYVTTVSDDLGRPTVMQLVTDIKARIYPVGRLDFDTTGLLIITNDGDFGHRVISPKSNIEKRYYACLDGEVKEEYKYVFQKGVTLASGEVCMPAKLEIEDSRSAYVTIREGKYHQIKRMFGVVGLGVDRLHRVSIGDLTLPCDLDVGQARELNEEELNKIIPKYR
jgi:23S rRNA pseudouridine2605 synthase